MTESNRPCQYYGSAMGCRYGNRCRYSHTNPNSIKLCRFYNSSNGCRYGNKCYYRHQTDIDNAELVILLSKQRALMNMINEAVTVLKDHQQNTSSQNPGLGSSKN